MADALIFAESDHGELRAEFWELLTVADDLGAAARVVVATSEAGDVVRHVAEAGTEVHVVDDTRLADPWPEGHAAAVASVAEVLTPQILLFPRTVLGSEVAARVATRLGAALLQDVTHIERRDGGLTARRPVFGGAVSATVTAPAGPFVVVPRPHAFAAAGLGIPLPDPVVAHPLTFPAPPRTTPGPRTRQADTGAPDIEKAQVLIAGGNGLGGPEPFQLLQEVAGLLHGTVAASRMACDAGWVPMSLQVGLTGKTVAPDVYLAVGISGATHHLAGCASAQVIAVINTDKTAPFFKLANLGVVGDWKDILPALRDSLREKAAQTSA